MENEAKVDIKTTYPFEECVVPITDISETLELENKLREFFNTVLQGDLT